MSTPLMKQYEAIKKNYKDSILFFRLGDFYEMFYRDAELASSVLGITLTSRDKSKNIPMAGVPYHSANSYISKLIKAGYKVAVCEQSNSFQGKIVKREVTQVITPGTFSDPDFLEQKDNNFIASITCGVNGSALSYVDLTTGEFKTTEFGNNFQTLFDRLRNISPRELVFSIFKNDSLKEKIERYAKENNIVVNVNIVNSSTDFLRDFFNVTSMLPLGLENRKYSIVSSASLLDYINRIQNCSSISSIFYEDLDNLVIDFSSRTNLNLIEGYSLFKVLDKTKTALGARLLKANIIRPLLSKSKIEKRYEDISYFTNNALLRGSIIEELKKIKDFERAYSRVLREQSNARDLNAIKSSLVSILSIYQLGALVDIDVKKVTDICKLLMDSILQTNSNSITDGNIIVPSFNEELSSLVKISIEGKSIIAELEKREQKKIGKAKVGYNRVFGYYIEVLKSNREQIPEEYIRKQTLSNAERYITEELKELEEKILGAKEKIVVLENKIFKEIESTLQNYRSLFKDLAEKVSYLDFIISLTESAISNNYSKPKLVDEGKLTVKDSRHPVVEKLIETFIPNDIELLDSSTIILTGPNMSGKSTFMKQLALIIIMAQIGSFVPASYAELPIFDKLFTRVGASDNISHGESTFMVEMNEVSTILKNATKNSLVILDEVGRGTSTYDGIAIARAVVEHIALNIKARTIFATHYHELNKLESSFENIYNYRVEVQEQEDGVLFLNKVVKGSADKSYGIEVARLAELPRSVLQRAKQLLTIYSKESSKEIEFPEEEAITEILKNIDLKTTSPSELYSILADIKRKI